MNQVLQFEGDLRMSIITALGALVAVNPDDADPFGNFPVEASAAIFGYEKGEVRQVLTKRRGVYNQAIYSDEDPGQSNISITLVAVPGALIARAFYGEGAESSVTGAAVVDEAITVTAKEVFLPLSKRYLDNTIPAVVKHTSGSPTYVAGTDYTIDYVRGGILIKTASAITVSASIKVSYTHKSYTLTAIRGGVKPTEKFYITGDMLNRPGKQDMALEIYEANLSVDGDVDLFSSDPLTVTLKGTLTVPAGKTEPYKATWSEVVA